MAAQKKVIIVCGEPSGDVNAAHLANALYAEIPGISIMAVGGLHLRQAGVKIIHDIKDLSVIGLFDVFKKLPLFLSLKNLILETIASEKPDAIILVDFSGFNLRLAKAINKKIPVIYYTSPQIWASRTGRVQTIKRWVNMMLVFFPFEADFYKKHGFEANFVGHPLLAIVKPSLDKKTFLHNIGLDPQKTTIALLPGSRKSEITAILPVMLDAARLIQQRIPETQFVIAQATNIDEYVYEDILKKKGMNTLMEKGRAYDCINASELVLVASGTATLETAILEKPHVVIYKMNLLNYLLYRPQVKIPYIGMANIVAGKRIVPECIQFKATGRNIADTALAILQNNQTRERILQELSAMKLKLGQPGAPLRAAKIIAKFITP
ncbi:MAG TPA: lipid-A-disaccharide synthase [Candidatus Omnitrophota bacterium]|nr:lipid-A-disaccharide synthase [Candidatus Omnitrophota bacterium]HPT07267.1 lipid-A-disaccharide synthase [Candidatus Omnitrophota bacterium]